MGPTPWLPNFVDGVLLAWPSVAAGVPGLALSGGPGADQAARALPRPHPVAEVLAEDLLQQRDVGLETRQEFPALLPAQGLALPAVPLQVPLERAGQGGRGQARDPAADRAARPLGRCYGPVRQRRFGVGGDVVPRHLRQHARLHAEERADPVQGLRGLVDQPPVAQDQDLLAREEREQVLELLAVAAEPGVVPEAGPARGDPALLLAAGPDEVGDRL